MKFRWQSRGRWRVRAVRGGKWIRERGRRSVSMVPHMFTVINLACGVYSILQTVAGNYVAAALLVGVALLADGLDGRIARLVRSDGEFGRELDSLADIISFGAAPAVLAYTAGLSHLGTWGLVIAAVFPICGALRLARFNLLGGTPGYFTGLPITAAGTLLAGLIFHYRNTALMESGLILPAAILALGYLMVSTVPYPDFKKHKRSPLRFVEWAGPALVVLWGLIRDPGVIIILPLITYAVLGPWLYLVQKAMAKVAEWQAADR